MHKSAAGIAGAQELVDFINGYKVTDSDGIIARMLKTVLRPILKVLFAGASIVKHIAIDYKFIKASGIQEAINLFGKDARLNEEGQIEIAIVDGIEELKDKFTLINTGLKVDGASIYRIKGSNLLMYGAKGQPSVKVAQALHGSKEIKKALQEMGVTQTPNTETEGVVSVSGTGIEMNNGLLEIGEIELEGKTPQQIKEYITTALEVKRALGIMYGQKTFARIKTYCTSIIFQKWSI